MASELKLTCPVCKARFREKQQCPRCHADLTQLMKVVGYAYRLREQARQALCQGHYQTAHQLAHQAQDLHHTSRGRHLLYVATIAASVRVETDLG